MHWCTGDLDTANERVMVKRETENAKRVLGSRKVSRKGTKGRCTLGHQRGT